MFIAEIERRLRETTTVEELPYAMVSSTDPVQFNPDGDVAQQVQQQQFPLLEMGRAYGRGYTLRMQQSPPLQPQSRIWRLSDCE